jgi:hypothetical protein
MRDRADVFVAALCRSAAGRISIRQRLSPLPCWPILWGIGIVSPKLALGVFMMLVAVAAVLVRAANYGIDLSWLKFKL